LVFERATIEVWIKTRGSVCPLSGEPLSLEELEVDKDLTAKIMAWHISTIAKGGGGGGGSGDDLYDF